MFEVLSCEAFTFLTARIRLSHAMKAKFPEIMVWPIRGQYSSHVICLNQSEESMRDDRASWYLPRFHILLWLECNDWSIIIILHHRDSQQTDRTALVSRLQAVLSSDWSRLVTWPEYWPLIGPHTEPASPHSPSCHWVSPTSGTGTKMSRI